MMKRLKLLFVILFPVLFAGFSIQNVHADIMDVVKMTELYECYVEDGAMKENVGNITSGKNIGHIISGTSQTVMLPNQYGHKINDNDLSCKQLVKGYSDISGQEWAAMIPEVKDNMSQEEARTVLKKLGYEPSSDGNNEGETTKCVQAVYHVKRTEMNETTEQEEKTYQVCVSNIDSNGKFTENSEASVNKINGIEGIDFDIEGSDKKTVAVDCADNNPFSRGGCGDVKIEKGKTWESFKQAIHKELSNNKNSFLIDHGGPNYIRTAYYQLLKYDESAGATGGQQESDGSDLNVDWKFKGGSAQSAAKEMLVRNSGWSRIEDVKFSEEEKSTLHKWYFTNFFKAKLICEGDEEYNSLTETNNVVKVPNKIDNKTCFAKADANSGQKVRGAKSDLTWYQEYSFAELVNAMKEDELLGAATVGNPGESGSDDSDGSGSSEEEDDPCYDVGIESMSWLLCPAINNGANTIDGMMSVIDLFMSVDAEKVFGDDARNAWTVFQNIANFVLIIVLLIIIFSQITGMGLNNYGIKKALPRLIMVAVLINLSWFICEILVDLSNILGMGLYGLLKRIGEGVHGGEFEFGEQFVAGLITAIFAAIAGGSAIAGMAAGAGGPIMVAISIGLTILVALVSVLIFFVMLGARMMAIIILTVISPVAFALYILPGTQGFFKKWWKVLQTCLVIYPICGALYGASFIIKAIAFGDTAEELNFTTVVWQIIGICAPFLPFLALPSLLKNAITGLGMMGGALIALSNGAKKGAGKGADAVKRSAPYREAQQRGLQKQAEQRALKIFNKTNRKLKELPEKGFSRFRNGRVGRVLGRSDAQLEEKYRQIQAGAAATLNQRDTRRNQEFIDIEQHRNPVPQITSALATTRVKSARQAQEMKNWSDQYSQMSKEEMTTELRSAVEAYRVARDKDPDSRETEQAAIRLSSALGAAESRGMYKEIFDKKNGLTGRVDPKTGQLVQNDSGLQLNGADKNDSIILGQMAASKNRVLSQYGKNRSKVFNDAGQTRIRPAASLHEFASGTIRSASSGDSLAAALKAKGSGALANTDDDTLKYIGGLNAGVQLDNSGSISNLNAFDDAHWTEIPNTETLIKTATQTTDGKVLAQVNSMLEQRTARNKWIDTEAARLDRIGDTTGATALRAKRDNYEVSGAELGKLSASTVRKLDSSVYATAKTSLESGDAASKQILHGMEAEAKKEIWGSSQGPAPASTVQNSTIVADHPDSAFNEMRRNGQASLPDPNRRLWTPGQRPTPIQNQQQQNSQQNNQQNDQQNNQHQ